MQFSVFDRGIPCETIAGGRQTIDTYHCRNYFDNCFTDRFFASDARENRASVTECT